MITIQTKILSCLDVSYSYQLARALEQFKTNPVLGYRTAGSAAEQAAGEFLFHEMQRIGLSAVTKDPFQLDTWEFSHARLSFAGHCCELASYQTSFDTHGPAQFSLLDAGKGTADDLQHLDVRGKLVLIDINQRDGWWISYPAYQAHLHGAAAVIAVQDGGYGQADPAALNAQNICGPADAPAFSISRVDAQRLRAYLLAQGGEALVTFDAKSTVGFDGTSYNIVGRIPGRDPDTMLLLCAHYDSYFTGFQDDHAAVAMMLGIARALLKSGCQPEKTLVFCAMAAEEWGVSNSKYDWSTGAYNQIFLVHPEWAGKTIAALNFELPAYAHGAQDQIRCVYEFQTFLQEFLKTAPTPPPAFSDGIGLVSPVLTWSDDFSLAIGGVPSLVNDFADGPFMQTHYHSQLDDAQTYQEDIYQFHHQLYCALLLAYDRCAIAPLDFRPRLQALRESLIPRVGIADTALKQALSDAQNYADALWQQVYRINHTSQASAVPIRQWNRTLLTAFRCCEGAFTRLGWHDEVLFPHEYPQRNLQALDGAYEALIQQTPQQALSMLCEIDTNRYACHFDDATCRYFVDYVLHQPDERLMWGAGRIPGLCELFEVVRALQHKNAGDDLTAELAQLRAAIQAQEQLLQRLLDIEAAALQSLCRRLAAMP
ncbi:MAG: M28 family peptidase [Anaerotruncus sp.]|nr:M28 family peptidase [Anaerotruncus sp.]